MTQPNVNFTSIVDSYRDAIAPLYQAQQEGVKTLERLVRYQFAVAGDYLDWSLSQAKASVGPKSPADLVGQQVALNTSFSEKLRQRAEEFSQIASETQGTLTKLVGDATDKVTNAAKKSA